MRKHTLLTSILLVSMALSAAFALAPQDEEPTPLQEAMHEIFGGQRKMRKLVRDPLANQEALVAACASVQAGALAAYSLAPAAPEGEDKTAWRIGYQRQMVQLLDAALELELAAHAGDAEAVGKAYARLGGAKETGHEQYKRD